jgi:hypothetical protein
MPSFENRKFALLASPWHSVLNRPAPPPPPPPPPLLLPPLLLPSSPPLRALSTAEAALFSSSQGLPIWESSSCHD